MPDERFEFDLVLRSEVVIHAPAAAVWELLGRLRDWKSSVATVERLAGPAGGVGEVLRVGQQAGDRIVYVVHRALAVSPGAWSVHWIETEDGRSTRGYVSYSLVPEGGGTRLEGQLLARASMPVEACAGLPPAEASRMICEATQAKFHADHLVLKRLVEEGKR